MDELVTKILERATGPLTQHAFMSLLGCSQFAIDRCLSRKIAAGEVEHVVGLGFVLRRKQDDRDAIMLQFPFERLSATPEEKEN